MLETRPETLTGKTHRIKTGLGWLYITINEHDDKPIELFAVMGKSGGDITAQAEAIGRLVSLALRHDIPMDKISKQLIDIAGSEQIVDKDTLIKSVPDAIGRLLHSLYVKTPLPTNEEESLHE